MSTSKLAAISILGLCCFTLQRADALGKKHFAEEETVVMDPVQVQPVFDDIIHAEPVMGTVTEEWAPPVFYKEPKYELEKVPIYYKEKIPVYYKGKEQHQSHHKGMHGHGHGHHTAYLQEPMHPPHAAMAPPHEGMPPHYEGMPPHYEGMPPHYEGMPPHYEGMPPHYEGMSPHYEGMPPPPHAGMPPPPHAGMPPPPHAGMPPPPHAEMMPPINLGDYPYAAPHDIAPHEMLYPQLHASQLHAPQAQPHIGEQAHIRAFDYGTRDYAPRQRRYPTAQVPDYAGDEIEWVHAPFLEDEFEDSQQQKYYFAEEHYTPRYVAMEQPVHAYVPVRCGLDKTCLRLL